jgi:hypothetical protein
MEPRWLGCPPPAWPAWSVGNDGQDLGKGFQPDEVANVILAPALHLGDLRDPEGIG